MRITQSHISREGEAAEGAGEKAYHRSAKGKRSRREASHSAEIENFIGQVEAWPEEIEAKPTRLMMMSDNDC
jgi:hypothetical protein